MSTHNSPLTPLDIPDALGDVTPGVKAGAHIEDGERAASLALGAALVAAGFLRGGRFETALCLSAGAYFTARGVFARDPLRLPHGENGDERRIAKSMEWPAAHVVVRSLTINTSPREIYDLCRNPERLQAALEREGARVSADGDRWLIGSMSDGAGDWSISIVSDVPGRLLAWRAIDDDGSEAVGRLEFLDARGGRGCELRATVASRSPRGVVGRALSALASSRARAEVVKRLKWFKQFVETGEIATERPRSAHINGT